MGIKSGTLTYNLLEITLSYVKVCVSLSLILVTGGIYLCVQADSRLVIGEEV